MNLDSMPAVQNFEQHDSQEEGTVNKTEPCLGGNPQFLITSNMQWGTMATQEQTARVKSVRYRISCGGGHSHSCTNQSPANPIEVHNS